MTATARRFTWAALAWITCGMGHAADPPHHVGFHQFTVPGVAADELLISVWYPTAAEPDDTTYSMAAYLMKADVARDAPPSPGPFPLVIYSHGGGGFAVMGAPHAEELAAHGFVVAGPDHSDEFSVGGSDGKVADRAKALEWVNWARGVSAAGAAGRVGTKYAHRPQEIGATIDAMLAAGADPDSLLHNMIDADRIGITGVSFGAWTTQACAGMFRFFRDDRLKAAAPIAGQVYRPSRLGGIANIRVPLLIIFGEDEHIALLNKNTPTKEQGMIELYEHADAPKVLVGIADAGHLHFGGAGVSAPKWRAGETPSSADARRNDPVLRPTNEYLLAFFERYLKGDQAAEERLKTKLPEAYIHRVDLGER